MKTFFIYTLFFCCLPFLVYSQNKKQKPPPCTGDRPSYPMDHIIQFEEGAWTKTDSCSDCATCQNKISDKLERSKTLTFYWNNRFIGSIDLVEARLISCDSVRYSIKNSVNFNLDGTIAGSLPVVLDALFDKIFACYQNPYQIIKLETPYQDFDFINFWFFLSKDDLLTMDDPKEDWVELHKVDEEPVLLECQDLTTQEERKKCTEERLGQFVGATVKYPAPARENGTEGTVLISCLIGKDGFVSDLQIARDIGNECGEAAYVVMEDMLLDRVQWIPAQKNGEAVVVRYFFKVLFRLE